MSFKKVFTKMGLIEEEVNTSTAVQAPVKQQATVRDTAYTPTPQPIPQALNVDPAMKDMIERSLQDNKLSGFDYLKFTSAIEEMKSLGTAEDARFKMAFFTAKQLGVDKPGLLKSGDHYLSILKQDEDSFNVNCAEYYKTAVQARATKLSQIEENITNLTKQLAQLQQDHITLKQELAEESSKLENKKLTFQLTLKNFRDNIETNIQKINQYL